MAWNSSKTLFYLPYYKLTIIIKKESPEEIETEKGIKLITLYKINLCLGLKLELTL